MNNGEFAGAISHCAKECSEELSRQWTNTEGKALATALLCRSGVFDIRWRPQRAQRLKYRIQCDRLRAGRGHAFFIGDLQLPNVVFPAAENFYLLISREVIVFHDLFGLFENRAWVKQGFFYVNHACLRWWLMLIHVFIAVADCPGIMQIASGASILSISDSLIEKFSCAVSADR